jgi:hypothetical protein
MSDNEIERTLLQVVARLEGQLESRETAVQTLETALVERLDEWGGRWTTTLESLSGEVRDVEAALKLLSRAFNEHLRLHGPSSNR